MSTLHEINPVVTSKKADAERKITDLHHDWKPDLFTGFTKNYKPKDDDGEVLPSEKKPLQQRVTEEIRKLIPKHADFIDCIATQDEGNTRARADIVVKGVTILSNVPVTTLMFLEKQLADMKTVIKKLPTLSTDKEWKWDDALNCYVTEVSITGSGKKVQRPIVLYPATDHHPAQTQLITEDINIGHWETKCFSGAISVKDKEAALERVTALLNEVNIAKARANKEEVEHQNIGGRLLDYIFGDLLK